MLCALSAMLLGDTLMYLLGKYTGWWLLGILCRARRSIPKRASCNRPIHFINAGAL